MRRAVFAFALVVSWCLPAASAEPSPPELRVLAAASMTEVIQALAARFEGARVIPSFGSSSELARQVVDGAPADVFISASPQWIDFLREKHALGGDAVVFAGNTLVAVAPSGSDLASRGVRDAGSLLAKGLAPGDVVAIADAGVPAGEYARQSLSKLGLIDAFEPLLVGQKDVRAVLNAVETGEVKAGFVYESDARVAKVGTLFALPADSHDPIQYLAAVVEQTRSAADAERFVTFLKGPVAREALTRAGFTQP